MTRLQFKVEPEVAPNPYDKDSMTKLWYTVVSCPEVQAGDSIAGSSQPSLNVSQVFTAIPCGEAAHILQHNGWRPKQNCLIQEMVDAGVEFQPSIAAASSTET